MRVVRSLTLIAILAGTASAQPASRQDAAEHFKKGQTAQAERRYRDAIDEYGAAFAIVPHANVLFNIAFCYEQLARWGQAADFYQRYLDFEPASDVAVVTAKVRELRAKAGPTQPEPRPRPPKVQPVAPDPNVADPNVTGDPNMVPTPGGTGFGIVSPPIEPAREPRWHGGVSYGLGFADTTVERYLAHGGARFAGRIDLDAILGAFGKNDKAIGVLGRFRFSPPTKAVTPFVRAAVTFGYARSDSSSSADTKFPLGLEAGGGVQLGTRGRVEIDAVVRYVTGGFGKDATAVDSFVNDSVAFAIDVGIGFDWPLLPKPGSR